MNRKLKAAIVLLALLVLAILAVLHRESGGAAFLDELNSMWSTPEHCEFEEHCELVAPRWNDTLKVAFGAGRSAPHPKLNEVKNAFEALLPFVSSYIAPDVVFDEDDANVIFVFVDEELIQELKGAEMSPLVTKLKTEELIEPVFRAGGCMATVGTSEENGIDEIVAALIWVNTQLEGDELTKCVVEEFVQSTGLLGDPPGYVSLFDHGNYRRKDGIILPSQRTECMLRAIYTASETQSLISEDFFDRDDIPDYCKL